MPFHASKRLVFLPTAFLVFGLDQLGKSHIATEVAPGARAPLFGDWLAWTNVPAMGGALGFFRDALPGVQLIGFAGLALTATLAIAFFYRGLAPREHGTAAALGALLGGVSSHALDRLRYGSGVDFLHLGSMNSNALPDFSLADVAIVLGVATLILELLTIEFATRASERPPR